MPSIDYYGIEAAIAQILRDDETLAKSNVRVTIEEEVIFGAESTPWIGIYIERRDLATGQPIAAGRRMRYQLRLALWCWQFSLDSVTTAIRLRDELIGMVEIALMKDRTLAGTVATSWLEGGEMPSLRGQTGFLSGGEIRMVADVVASL